MLVGLGLVVYCVWGLVVCCEFLLYAVDCVFDLFEFRLYVVNSVVAVLSLYCCDLDVFWLSVWFAGGLLVGLGFVCVWLLLIVVCGCLVAVVGCSEGFVYCFGFCLMLLLGVSVW